VIPKELLRQVRRIEIATRRKVSSRFAGGYLSTFRGQGMEFDEVREYRAGDDIRAIDWNVTARTGAPYVKRFVVEREMTVLLVVDASASLAFGSGARTKGQVAGELCSLLAALAVRSGDRVGLVRASDRVERYLPPGKGPKHLYRVIRELLAPPRPGSGTDLVAAVDFARRVAPRHSTVFVVSDFLLPPGAPGLERALARAALRHDVIALPVGDPREDDLPAVGLLTAEDPETGRTVVVDTADPAFRAAHRERARAEREALLALLRRHGIDHVPLSTGASYVEPLLRFFRTRARRLR
jgi:uncharacterized protein (DUF58 family)